MTAAQAARKAKRAAWLAGKQVETAKREATRPAFVCDKQSQRLHLDSTTTHRDYRCERKADRQVH
jgi:hypothetical protein